MKTKKITEYIFWLISYYPVIMVVLYKSFETEINGFIKFSFQKYYAYREYLVFIAILLTTLLLYRLVLKIFTEKIRNKVTKYNIKQSVIINRFEKLSLDKYSFFILSLMLPFIFQSTDNVFDLLLIVSLIGLLIYVMVKMNQIMVNPIFLFSNLKIYEANVSKDNNINKIDVAIITNLSLRELEKGESFLFYEYFNKVYFIMKK